VRIVPLFFISVRTGLILFFILMTLVMLFAILRRARQFGGFRDCLHAFVRGDSDSKPILLFLLIVPDSLLLLLGVLALCHAAPPDSVNLLLVTLIAQNIVLSLYFLNGWFVARLRGLVQRSINLWNRFGMFRV
jgi:hypothetical protein